MDKSSEQGYKFGTFAGVFTPSILTIFGLIMFMRTGEVVGKAGVGFALLILVVSNLITLSTGLSLSAISTNTPVSGGGVYFLISRTLGPAFGGSIGVTLFLAQAMSIPFYIIGFTSSLGQTVSGYFPAYSEWIVTINIATALLLFFISWVGAKWAIKSQFFILCVLILAIIAFLSGMTGNFSGEVCQQNFGPAENYNLYALFALFFPAVTGVMTGVNMSGDLKEPARSIPKGSLLAIAVSFVVYGIQIVLTGGAFSRETMTEQPFVSLRDSAIFGTAFLVTAGVFAATISSAIGSFLGAPRVLQALGKDRIFGMLRPFAKGEGASNDPRRATVLSLVITLIVLALVGKSSEGAGLNAVASVLTMFFLYTYGMVNFAAFVESFGKNPSFRPRFKFYHWSTALFGAVSCLVVSFMISAVASLVALVIMFALYMSARRKTLTKTFGDARRGFVYSMIRNNLFKLEKLPLHPKNWRPTMAVLTGNPSSRLALVEYAVLFECRRGLVSLVEFLVGDFEKLRALREEEQQRLSLFVEENKLEVFTDVVVTPDFDSGLCNFLQSHSIGPIKPNIIMQGWPRAIDRVKPFMNHLNTVLALKKSCLVYVDLENRPCPDGQVRGTIDIWWRGQRNGSLMMLLAYLLIENPSWKNVGIRILRTVRNEAEVPAAEKAMKELIASARVNAEAKVIVSESFDESLRTHSSGASLLFLGFNPPPMEVAEPFFEGVNKRMKGLPPAFFVCSSGEADLTA